MESTQEVANQYESVYIQGDIKGCYVWKRGGMSFKVIHGGASFECKAWERDGMDVESTVQLENHNCIVHGTMVADYFSTHRFALHVDSITVVDRVTKLKTLKQQCEAKKLFTHKKPIDWSTIKTLGIISKPSTQGYVDFTTQFKIPCRIMEVSIALEGPTTAQQCSTAINTMMGHVDAIIIVRGGGNTVDISNSYDDLELFKTIKMAAVPIITAIGHHQDCNDALLITKVSDVDFSTPSTAANEMTKTIVRPWVNTFTKLEKDLSTIVDTIFSARFAVMVDRMTSLLDKYIQTTLGGPLVVLDNAGQDIANRDNGGTIVVFDGTHYRQVNLRQCPILEQHGSLEAMMALKRLLAGIDRTNHSNHSSHSIDNMKGTLDRKLWKSIRNGFRQLKSIQDKTEQLQRHATATAMATSAPPNKTRFDDIRQFVAAFNSGAYSSQDLDDGDVDSDVEALTKAVHWYLTNLTTCNLQVVQHLFTVQ